MHLDGLDWSRDDQYDRRVYILKAASAGRDSCTAMNIPICVQVADTISHWTGYKRTLINSVHALCMWVPHIYILT